MAGMSRDALAQAITRARRTRNLLSKQAVRTPGGTFPPRGIPQRLTGTTGPADWYEPRQVLAWLRNRPGHGPGRGHKQLPGSDA